MLGRLPARFGAFISLAALMASGVTACSDEEKAAEPMAVPADVIVRPETYTLTAGGKLQLAAQVNDASGKPIGGASIEFRSSNTALLSVSKTGLVRSLGPTGAAVVTVSSAKQRAKVTVTVVHGVAAKMMIQSGDGQVTQVTKALNEALVVKVTDRAGNPVGGSVVTFKVADGRGQVAPATVTADGHGLAKTYWTTGPKAGVQVVRASSPGLAGSPVSFSATVTPGPPTKMAAIGGAPKKVTAGETVPLRVRLLDEHGNPSAAVAVAWTVREGKANLKPERGQPDAAGTAETRWVPTLAGPGVVAATAGNVEGSPTVFRSLVVPGPPARLEIVAGDKQIGRVGRPLPTAPTVRVTDRFGNAVAGAAVLFEVKPGAGAVARKQGTSNDEGLVSAGPWRPGRSGFNALTARLPGEKGASVELQAAAPARVTVSGPGRVPRELRRFPALSAAPPTPRITKPVRGPVRVTPGGSRRRPGTACKALPPASLRGAIAVVAAGACAGSEVEGHLVAAGAIAALVYHPRASKVVVMDGFAGKIPILMLARDDARGLADWVREQRAAARAAAAAARDAAGRVDAGARDGGRTSAARRRDGGAADAGVAAKEPMATISVEQSPPAPKAKR